MNMWRFALRRRSRWWQGSISSKDLLRTLIPIAAWLSFWIISVTSQSSSSRPLRKRCGRRKPRPQRNVQWAPPVLCVNLSLLRSDVKFGDGPAVSASQHALQIEHCVPVALAGESTLDNLKLFCRSCNQRAAIEVFGVEKMAAYLN